MNGLFSNRYRLYKLGIAILFVSGLCIYTHIVGNQYVHQKLVILEQCLKNSVSCISKPLVMRAQIGQSSDESFIAYPRIRGRFQLEYPVPLAGDLVGLQHGYVIDILGAYSPESTFIVTKYHRDNWIRTAKYTVSILGLLLTVILLFRRYRFSSHRFFPLIHR